MEYIIYKWHLWHGRRGKEGHSCVRVMMSRQWKLLMDENGKEFSGKKGLEEVYV